MDRATIKRRSRGWLILPVVFGLLGAIIAWLAVKNDDPELGTKVWLAFWITLAVGIVLAFASAGSY